MTLRGAPGIAEPIGSPDAVERWVGQRLAEATPDDLQDAIESTVEDPAYWSMLRPPSSPLNTQQELELGMRIAVIFGQEPAFASGYRDHMFVAEALPALAPLASAASVPSTTDPLWFVSDPRIPPPLGRALLHGAYANVAFLGVVYTARVNLPREARWKRLLVERWASSLHEYARFVASVPFINAPEEVVPAHERFDLDALDRQNAAMHRAFARLVDDAERADAYPYAPFADRGHDPA